MGVELISVSPGSPEVQALFRELNAELMAEYPGHVVNDIDVGEFEAAGGYMVVAKIDDEVVGCGGIRPLTPEYAEVKRMYVRPTGRRRGIARQILRRLEAHGRERGFETIVVETGCRQYEAIALYRAEGYFPIPPFLGYAGDSLSRCYAKAVRQP